jgi:hypothetical protein
MNPKTDSIKLSDCATTLQEARGVIDRQEALIEQLRKDKARLRETLAEIGEYRGEGGPATPWQDIVRDLGQMARAEIAAAMEGDNERQ